MERARWEREMASLAATSCAEDTREALQSLLQLSLSVEVRESCLPQEIGMLILSLEGLMKSVRSGEASLAQLSSLATLLKILRNMCAGVPATQSIIGKEENLAKLVDFLDYKSSSKCSDDLALVDTILQLLGNVCTKNQDNQQRVWTICFPRCFRSDSYSSTVNICCMVILSCVRNEKTYRDHLISEPQLLADAVSCLQTAEHSEWMLLLLEHLIETVSLQQLLSSFDSYVNVRLFILERVLAYPSNEAGPAAEETSSAPQFTDVLSRHSNLEYLLSLFNEVATHVTSGGGPGSDEVTFKLFVSVLRILCQCSCYTHHLQLLQSDGHILKHALDMLSLLSELAGPASTPETRQSIAITHGVKRDVVQLIGNLCYHCPVNQQQAGEPKSLDLILSQCRVDFSNPYIMQWALWTVRNLCEGNLTNQEYIAQLEAKTTLNMQDFEREFGCEVEIGPDGRMRLKRAK